MSLGAHLSLLTAAALLLGCSSTDPQGDAPPAPPHSEPASEASPGKASLDDPRLIELQASLSLVDQERSALARHYFETGQRLFSELKYREAAKCYDQALEADPNDAAILKAKLRTDYILGDRNAEFRTVAEVLQEGVQIRIQERGLTLKHLFSEAEELFAKGHYERAQERFERVLEMIRWYPFELDRETYQERARQRIVEAKQARRVSQRAENEARSRRALAAANRERQRIGRERQARLDTLLARARSELKRGRPRRAEQTLREVAALDARNPDLSGLRRHAIALRHRTAERGTYARNKRNQRLNRISNDEAAIPTLPGD